MKREIEEQKEYKKDLEKALFKTSEIMDHSKILNNSSMIKDNTLIIKEDYSVGEASNLFLYENMSIPLNDIEFMPND